MRAMTSASGAPGSPRRRLPLIAGAAAFVVLAAVLVLVLGGGDGGGEEPAGRTAGSDAVALRFPATWEQLPRADVRRAGDNAVAGVRRRDDTGLLVIRRESRRRQPLDQIATELRRELEDRFEDFRFVGRRTIETRAGQAFYFSFARTRAGTAHSVTLARLDGRDYSLTGVVSGRSRQAATEIGTIIRSFGPASD